MEDNRLTICSVSFNSKTCLNLNWSLTTHLNSEKGIKWLVAENSDVTSKERISSEDKKFTVIEGFPAEKVFSDHPEIRVSYHHALALNELLKRVETRYVLFLDPDFFILRRNWVRDVIKHMGAHNISFFGACYSPGRHIPTRWYRYFPCVWCLFMDLKYVSKIDLDFTPEIFEAENLRRQGWKDLLISVKNQTKSSGLTLVEAWNMLKKVLPIKLGRLRGPVHRYLGLQIPEDYYRDTGYRIYSAFSKSQNHLRECLTLRWSNPLLRESSFGGKIRKTYFKYFVPENFCPYPKRTENYTSLSFNQFDLPDLFSMGWDEYFWQEKPFAFHVRPGLSGRSLFGDNYSFGFVKLEEVVARLMGKTE